MADNTQINQGSGGGVISTDDIGSGVKVQRVKIQYGTDGLATDVSESSPLPISGTVTVSNPSANPETGLAKDATLTGGTLHPRVLQSQFFASRI